MKVDEVSDQAPCSLTEMGTAAAAALKRNQQTIGIAESSTGGLIAASLLAVPGASAYFLGGTVIYTRQSRKLLLGISAEDVAGLAPLSEAMAARFAQAARLRFGATWGLAELGIAGPTGVRYGEPGISVIAIDGPVRLSCRMATGRADREANMWAFTRRALALLSQALDATHASAAAHDAGERG